MPTAAQIREGIENAAALRREGQAKLDEGTLDLQRWLRAAKESPDFSVDEAAQLAGISRIWAYQMLQRNSKR